MSAPRKTAWCDCSGRWCVAAIAGVRLRECRKQQRRKLSAGVALWMLIVGVLASILLAGCSELFGPTTGPFPPGAVEYEAPAIYSTWWAQIDSCSGRPRPMDEMHWFMVPDVFSFDYNGLDVYGRYAPPRVIILADLVTDLAPQVRHEMLHAHLPITRDAHPAEFFRDKCGAFMVGGDEP